MIINGASRSNGAFFSRHLMRVDDNERVAVVELRGLAYAQDVPSAFRELKELAEGTACKNYFYHANLNTRLDEVLTPEQWAQAVDTLEGALHLDGQPRFIVEHEKDGRTHRHVIWSRVDQDSRTAVSDSHNFRRHEEVASALEESFGHEATARALTRDKGTTPRPDPNVKDWESFRGAYSGLDPKAIKAELTELWQRADSGPAFAAAIEERGYILARGDRRDFCVIDQAGDEHSLARRISGVKASEIRARMADVDPAALPSVDEGRELARLRQETSEDGSTSAPVAETPATPFDAVMSETAGAARAEPAAQVQKAKEAASPAFAEVMAETARQAEAEAIRAAEEESAAPGGRFERFRAWWGGMRDYVQGFGQQAMEYWNSYFRREEPEQTAPAGTAPDTTVSAAELAQPVQQKPQGMEPSV